MAACQPGSPVPAAAARETLETATQPAKTTQPPVSTPIVTDTPPPPTATATETLAPSPTPISTSDAWATAEPLLAGCEQVKSWGHSPDQQWIWSLCQPAAYNWITTRIVNETSPATQWKLSYKNWLPGETRAISASLYPFYWSSDGRFLYLTPWVRRGDADLLSNGGGLMRLDLKTGKISRIIQGQLYDLFALSFSADERYLAYMNQFTFPLRLKILDNKTGGLTYVEMKGNYAAGGSILWAADNERVVLTLGTDPALGVEQYSVWVINFKEETQDEIISNQADLLEAISWEDATIQLKNRWNGEMWAFDLESRQMSQLPKPVQ